MHATEPHGGVVVWIQMREWQYISRNAQVATTAGGKATVSRFPLENVTNEGNFKKFRARICELRLHKQHVIGSS